MSTILSNEATTLPNDANDAKERLRKAKQFLQDYPDEKTTTAARIYKVNRKTLDNAIHRQPKYSHGGHNKMLSDIQIAALYKYVVDQYKSGFGASKRMTFAAISHLKAAEIPPKPAPSWIWFTKFLKAHPSLHTIKTKPIARIRTTLHDTEEVEKWFHKYRATIQEHNIMPKDIYNFDETGVRVGCPPGEEIIVPIYVKEV
jgi:hypothetical protein